MMIPPSLRRPRRVVVPCALRARSRALVAPAALALLAAPALAPAQTAPVTPTDPIFVTASRMAQPLSSVLADISVLTREDIERSGVSGVADLLARLPGIEF